MRRLTPSPQLLVRVPLPRRASAASAAAAAAVSAAIASGVSSPAWTTWRLRRSVPVRGLDGPARGFYTVASGPFSSLPTIIIPFSSPLPAHRPPSRPSFHHFSPPRGSSREGSCCPLSSSSSASPNPPRPNRRPPPPPEPPFRFETGVALFAKRVPRPFPPPFLSPPSGSFSDPLSTHHGGRRAGPIRGKTNGDDAVYASDRFVCANDGVGAWSTRPRGHAGLWARLILHFWVLAIHEDAARPRAADDRYVPDPVGCLQQAYEKTIEATSPPNDWQGTTTVCGAQLHYQDGEEGAADEGAAVTASPLLYVTNLGDSQVMVVRPSTRSLVYKTVEQWHWFDCPRQLGTNSPDAPRTNAVVDQVPIREGDVVLAMTDGVIDNLWAHEIVDCVSDSVARWEAGEGSRPAAAARDTGGMAFVADELMEAAKRVALDPFAESPFMEHAIEEGLASEGGKLDDISVVAALCTRATGQ